MFSSKKNILGLFISPPLSDKGVDIKNFCLDLYSQESISYNIGLVSYGRMPPLSDIDREPARWMKNLHFLPPLPPLLRTLSFQKMFGSSSFFYDLIRSLLLSRNEFPSFDDVLNYSSSFLTSLDCSYSIKRLRIFYSLFFPIALPFLLINELYRFFTICYVLHPQRSLAIWLHFLPFS